MASFFFGARATSLVVLAALLGCTDDVTDGIFGGGGSGASDGGGGDAPTTGGTGGSGASGGDGGNGGDGGSGGSPPGSCGDGQVDFAEGEQCDDGNVADGDGCSATCQIEPPPNCGDGNVDIVDGEECDDGNTVAGDGCSAACLLEPAPTCGNGTLDIVNDEECDDGNTVGGDGCSPSCQFEIVGQTCGDASLQGLEVCDDGNLTNGDACNPTCNFTNTVTDFVGSPGQPGSVDGVGAVARLAGAVVMTVTPTHLIFTEEGSRTIRLVDIATALVTTIAGQAGAGAGYVDAPIGLNARFGSVEAITTDGSTVWIADAANGRIRAMSLTAPYAVTTVAGSGVPGYTDGIGAAVQFEGIRGLTYYDGFVYFLDPTAATVRRLDPGTTEVVTLAGTPYQTGQVDGIGANARFISPRYMASDGSGMLFISDTNGNKLRAFNTTTTEVTTFAGSGICGYVDGNGTGASVHRPRGMTSDGTSIYWVEFNAHTVRQAVVATGDVTTMIGTPPACSVDCSCPQPPVGSHANGVGAAALLNGPFSVVFHYPSSSLFVADSGNSVIRRVQ